MFVDSFDPEVQHDRVLAHGLLKVVSSFHSGVSVAVRIRAGVGLLGNDLVLRVVRLMELSYRLMSGLDALTKHELLGRQLIRRVIPLLLVRLCQLLALLVNKS